MRMTSWKDKFGLHIGSALCTCCNLTTMHQMDFHCGHIIAERNGGETVRSNLCPVCAGCNWSMGATNMNIFASSLVQNVLKSSSVQKNEHQLINVISNTIDNSSTIKKITHNGSSNSINTMFKIMLFFCMICFIYFSYFSSCSAWQVMGRVSTGLNKVESIFAVVSI